MSYFCNQLIKPLFMKIVKVFFIFALVSMIAVSCKETKKEEVQDDAAVEMTEEESSVDTSEEVSPAEESEVASESDSETSAAAAGAGGAAATAASSSEATEDTAAKEAEVSEPAAVEELVVPEGVIAEEMADTPVVYPGCSGSGGVARLPFVQWADRIGDVPRRYRAGPDQFAQWQTGNCRRCVSGMVVGRQTRSCHRK